MLANICISTTCVNISELSATNDDKSINVQIWSTTFGMNTFMFNSYFSSRAEVIMVSTCDQ